MCSGRGTNIIESKKCPITKGDLFIIGDNVKHQIVVDTRDTGPLVIYNCIFTPDFLTNVQIDSDLFQKIVGLFLNFDDAPGMEGDYPCLVVSDTPENTLEEYFEKMYIEYSTAKEGHYDMLRFLFCQFLIDLYRIYEKRALTDVNATKNYDAVQIAIKYLMENYAHKLSLDDLSPQVYLSKSHFSKVFKEATGMKVFEYLQKIRIENAQRLMHTTELSMNEICEQVGYSDYSFFNRVFKRVTGLTPQEYKKKSHLEP